MMRRSVINSTLLICASAVLIVLSIYTPAQTKDLPEANSEKKRLEPAAATAAAEKASDGKPCRRGDEKCDRELIPVAVFNQSTSPQKGTPEQPAQTAGQAPTATNDKEQEKNGELVIAPYPVSSPALGTGLQWVAGYVFKLDKEDKVTPPSFFGTAGMYTNNGSWAMAFGGSFHLKQDQYRVAAIAITGDINFDFYGIGRLAGERGLFLPISISGKGFLIQPLYRIAKNLYLGPRFQVRKIDAQIDFSALRDRGLPEEIDRLPQDIVEAVPDDLLSTRTVAIGPRLQRDTRDDQFYPTKGTVLNGGVDFFLKALGSKFNYQIYQVRFEGYRSLDERQVLAFGSIGCAAAGDRVPFYDLCLYGARNYVRGYAAGKFQDRRMWATQMEYRLRLPRLLGIGLTERLGIVGFGGVGWVGKELADFALDDMLPGGGGGLRFRLTKKYPINFRIDYGFGRGGHTLSMGVGEAF